MNVDFKEEVVNAVVEDFVDNNVIADAFCNYVSKTALQVLVKEAFLLGAGFGFNGPNQNVLDRLEQAHNIEEMPRD